MSYLYNRNYKIDNLLKIFSWKCRSRFCHAIVHKASIFMIPFLLVFWIMLNPAYSSFFLFDYPLFITFSPDAPVSLMLIHRKKRDIFLLRQIPMFPSFAGYGCHHITRDNFNTLDSGMLYLSPYNSPVFSNAEGKIIRHLLRDMSILISRFHKCSL